MTYTTERRTNTTWAEVGGQLYQVPSNYPGEPLDDAKYQGGQIINTATNPLKANRYLVTLIHRYSGEEKLVDLLIDNQGFTAIAQEVRKHIGYVWEFFEFIDTAEPF